MDEIEVSESFVQEQEKNQFLDDDFTYENCPHCQRNFFIGKLKYHLKLCKPTNPMTKSPLKKSKRSYISTALQKSQPQIDRLQIHSPISFSSPQKYKKCYYCRATFSLIMLDKHTEKCNMKPSNQTNPEDMKKLRSRTKIDFGMKKDLKEPSSALPRIRNSAKENKNVERKFVSQEVKDLKAQYTVRIREDLSCFKKALQVQQIQCQYCHRKFSKEASLRHIPICEKIKIQQMHQVALKKHSKSQIYKLSIPVKKNTLFRSKFLGNLSEKNEHLEIKSARVYQVQKVERQKISNSSLMMKREKRRQKRLSDLKPLKPLMIKEVEPIQNEPEIQKPLISKRKQTPITEMNMTFSKNLHDSSKKASVTVDVTPRKKYVSQRLHTFEKQEGISQFEEMPSIPIFTPTMRESSKFKKEYTEEVENEFLQVTVSKKKFFAEIVFDGTQNIFQKKTQSPLVLEDKENDTRKIRLNIELKDFSKKKDNDFSVAQTQEYKLDFDE